jgi:hypothetical protein
VAIAVTAAQFTAAISNVHLPSVIRDQAPP